MPVDKVGVILVHGIGEQRRFEHLESETRKIVDAIIANYGQRRRDVTITLKTGVCDEFLGGKSTWVSGAEAPLHAVVDLGSRFVDIAFHEVWWADVNETLTLSKQVRFWWWGLGLPGFAPYQQGIPGMRPPRHAGELTWWQRLRIAYVSIMFGMSAFSIALVNMLLRRLKFAPLLSTDVIINYLSGVKLFSQHTRAGGSPMEGPDEPPRVAIRRRMVRAMIDVAVAGYKRWYIMAHSLGSVAAWNGLMELKESLPNYLDLDRWIAAAAAPLLRGATGVPFDVTAMLPNRPVWLGRQELINRDALFANFKGILTYGSPLERFNAIWSDLVLINEHEDPFPADAEWINVYDPTDPVGTWIANFDPNPLIAPQPGSATLKPRNFPCRASPVLLLSHICYFTASRLRSLRVVDDAPNLLVNQVAHWLVEGGSLANRIDAAPKGNQSFWLPLTPGGAAPLWQVYLRATWRYVQWLIVGAGMTALTLLSLHYVIYPSVGVVLRWAKSLIF